MRHCDVVRREGMQKKLKKYTIEECNEDQVLGSKKQCERRDSGSGGWDFQDCYDCTKVAMRDGKKESIERYLSFNGTI
jgi:hypothetical protein